jgi:hypothetical protein
MGIVIGLHGAKGSGKDQFYKAVKANFPLLDVRKIAYADPIKTEVCRIFGLQNEHEYDEFKRTELTFSLNKGYTWCQVAGRQAVREIGMMMRGYNEQQFVRYVEDEINKAPNAIWCITDLRFRNELDSVRNLEGIVIKIKRGGVSYDGHVTELEFSDSECTSVIENIDLTLEQYESTVVDEMKRILQTMSIMKRGETI